MTFGIYRLLLFKCPLATLHVNSPLEARKYNHHSRIQTAVNKNALKKARSLELGRHRRTGVSANRTRMSDSASVGMDSNQKRRVTNHNLRAPVPPKPIRPAFFLKFGDSCLYPTVVYHLLWAPKGSDNVSGRSMIEKQESINLESQSWIPPK